MSLPRRISKLAGAIIALLVLTPVGGCAYMDGLSRQVHYAQIQRLDPSQHNKRHMINRQNFFVHGRVLGARDGVPTRLMVAAFSSQFEDHELVSHAFVAATGTHYGLNLPAGDYDLRVFSDLDQNGVMESSEQVGSHRLFLAPDRYPDMVAGDLDITLTEPQQTEWTVAVEVPATAERRESIFFPNGAVRPLDDPIFDPALASLGMYDPAAFMDEAPMMFYSPEDNSHKIPVVFVHGIGGGVRDFEAIVDALDRDRYQPFFFYYPSGADLDQLAALFYSIYLSGNAYGSGPQPMIIVAHSMGGLVVREALNRFHAADRENRLEAFVSIASPFGGHPAAARGAQNSPLVLPSWRDLDPDSNFIRKLFRNDLPDTLEHRMIYAYGDPRTFKRGENSDGVVPISSQLDPRAQAQASQQLGVDNSHVGVLGDPLTIRTVIDAIESVANYFPDHHLKFLEAGGFDVALDDGFTDREKYMIHSYGRYLHALANGALDDIGDDVIAHFIKVVSGKGGRPQTDSETAWIKFRIAYPELAGSNVEAAISN